MNTYNLWYSVIVRLEAYEKCDEVLGILLK